MRLLDTCIWFTSESTTRPALQELYGNSVAGQLLSSFSRLFTFYLQNHGFTCGIDDLLLVGSCERARQVRWQETNAAVA